MEEIMERLGELIVGDIVTWGKNSSNQDKYINHCDDDDPDGIGDDGMDGPEVDED